MSGPVDLAAGEIPAHPAQWAELVTVALLGTERRAPDDLAAADAPGVLLRRAARHRILDRLAAPEVGAPAAGEAAESAPTPPPAPAPDRLEASYAADRLLDELLRTPDPALVNCWLAACAAHRRTVAAVHWTRLARLAARTTAYDRRMLGEALGPRGRWFLQQNPEWRKLAADVAGPPVAEPSDERAPAPPSAQIAPATLTTTEVLADPELIFGATRPWGPELVSAAYAVLGGAGPVPPPRGFATRLGVALPTQLYASIAQAGEYYVLNPDATPARRRTIRDRFVALELAAYARAAIDHAFSTATDDASGPSTRLSRAEIPHV